MSAARARRWKLRNLDIPQKLLAGVMVGFLLSASLAALLNVFAQHSEADGKSTIQLDQFLATYKREGFVALMDKIQKSLGMEDVVRHYHGTGSGTQFQAALEGSMKEMIKDKLIEDGD